MPETDHPNTKDQVNALACYFLVTYALSWFLWAPYYSASWFPATWHTSPFFHFAGALGPLCGALVTRYRYGRKLFTGFFLSRQALFPAAAALLLPFVVLGVSLCISYLATGAASLKGIGTSHELPAVSWPIFVVLNVAVIGIGEEAGWRGFVLPCLQRHFSAFTASLVLSVGWAIWHWPLFFYPNSGFYTMALPDIAGWLFSLALGSVLLTWLFNWSAGSILVCALFHGTMDITFTAPYSNGNVTTYNGMLITIVGILVIVIFKRAHLSPARKIQSE